MARRMEDRNHGATMEKERKKRRQEHVERDYSTQRWDKATGQGRSRQITKMVRSMDKRGSERIQEGKGSGRRSSSHKEDSGGGSKERMHGLGKNVLF